MEENIKLDKIPLEIIQCIVSYLNASSSLSLLLVNKKISAYFLNDIFFWKHITTKLGLYVPKNQENAVKALKNCFQEWKSGKLS